MSMTAAALATLFPWAAGWCWMRCLHPGRSDAAIAVQVGYGFFLGMLATALAVRVLAPIGIGASCLLTALLLAASSGGALYAARRHPAGVGPPGLRAWWRAAPGWHRAFLGALIALIALHAGMLAVEVWHRPLFAWDAWMHWAPKAKVWTELGVYVPFGSREAWLATGGEVYTIRNWQYPEFVPLLQTWVAAAAGGWHDRAVNLPWLGAFIALLAGLYGHARRLGYGVLSAAVPVWLLATMPVVNLHVALPGYADLWVGAFLGLSAAAMLAWARERNPADLALALLFWAALAWTKIPGLAWMAVLLPALAAAALPARVTLAGLACAGAVAAVVLALGGISFPLPGNSVVTLSLDRIVLPVLGEYTLGWRGAGGPFLEQLLAYPAWHLAFYLLPAAFLAGLWRMPLEPARIAGVMLVLASLGFIVLALLFTGRSDGIEEHHLTNRAWLHAMPAMLVAIAAMLAPCRRRA